MAEARTDAVWKLDGVAARYPGVPCDVLDGVTLALGHPGVTAVVGPNGAGKSTLMLCLQGLLAPSRGTVLFSGRPATAWTRPAFAREVGVLPQGEELVLPLTVRDLVAMGRYPHLGAWRAEGAADRAAIGEALALTCTEELATRRVDALSGGERQRVRVARALAQEAPTLLLDEPTAALDIRFEMQLFELIRQLGDAGRRMVVVTHALELAARYADRIVLLAEGRLVAAGTPATVLTEAHLEAAYRWPMAVTARGGEPGADGPRILPLTRREAEARRDAGTRPGPGQSPGQAPG